MNSFRSNVAFVIGTDSLKRRRRGEWGVASGREVPERCGLHRTFIGSMERGERNVSTPNWRQIARVLQVSLAEVLSGLS
jgi:hypothetical protein